MNIQRQERGPFGIAVDVHISVLSGENWTDTEIPEVEVISGVHEGTEFVAAGASACEASLQQRLPARVIAIMTAVHAPVYIESLIPVGGV